MSSKALKTNLKRHNTVVHECPICFKKLLSKKGLGNISYMLVFVDTILARSPYDTQSRQDNQIYCKHSFKIKTSHDFKSLSFSNTCLGRLCTYWNHCPPNSAIFLTIEFCAYDIKFTVSVSLEDSSSSSRPAFGLCNQACVRLIGYSFQLCQKLAFCRFIPFFVGTYSTSSLLGTSSLSYPLYANTSLRTFCNILQSD